MEATIEPTIVRRRVGTEEKAPQPITLRAGALTADFVRGGLRAIRHGNREVLRAISYVVRDKDWGTYNPGISDYTCRQGSDGFTVAFRGRCNRPETGEVLEYEARITGKDGQLTFDVTAEPQTDFLTARCGFTVLHPLDGVAGQPATIEHVDGSLENAKFPELIAPWQPFKEIRAIRHQVEPGITARCRFTGDTFEMEDQRLWSDASYKTYVRPLALPWPYVMEQGVRNSQSVELQIIDARSAVAIPVGDDAGTEASPIVVELGEAEGIFPRIGVAIDPSQIGSVLDHPAVLIKLQPQMLLFHFDPSRSHGRTHLSGLREIASHAEGAWCVLELVLPAQRRVEEELSEVAAMIAESGLRLSAVLVSPAADRQSTLPGSAWPPCPPLAEIYHATRATFPGLAIGGGSLCYFTELTRKRPPVDDLDFVSHCTCPIVHAADDLSVMETLETLPYITRSARAIIGRDKPYWIGPSTIGMRQNPYGSRVMDNPENRRITMTDHDPRQSSLFAAAWMIGYAAATAEGQLQALTVGALTGPLGLVSASPHGEIACHPAFHTARGLAAMAGRPRYRCRSSRPESVAAVAGSDKEGSRVIWLANLTAKDQTVTLAEIIGIEAVHVLDEEHFPEPRVSFEKSPGSTNPTAIELRPYAVARLHCA